MRFIRRIDSSKADPSAGGVAPAAMPVLPPCGTNGTPILGGKPHDLGHFIGRSRRQHRCCRAMHPAAPVGRPWLDLARIGDYRLGPELLRRLLDQLVLASRSYTWAIARLAQTRDTATDGRMDRPPITLVVARAQNGVIGRDGKLPWHLPADLKRFKALTMGSAMVMGRKTFESLPGLASGPAAHRPDARPRLAAPRRGDRSRRGTGAASWPATSLSRSSAAQRFSSCSCRSPIGSN